MPKHSGGIAAAAVLAVLCARAAQAQDGGAVQVLRGAQSEMVRFDFAGGVKVERGQPPVRVVIPKPETGPAPATVVGAGETLWIVDDGGARLRACEVRVTTQVGGRVIRCTETALATR